MHLLRAVREPALASEAHYLLGLAYFESGDYMKATAELEDLRDSPHAEHVLYLLEESYRLSGRVKEARQTFRDLNHRFSDSPWTHYLLGEAYENQSQNEKAIEEYKAALARNPAQQNASFAIGYIYWRDKNYEAAKEWLDKELTIQPCHSLAGYYRGEIARNDQDPQTAAGFYRHAIECDRQNVKAHVGLGIALSELNRDDQAIQALREAVRLDPKNSTPHYRLAVVYKKLGRKAEAQAEYDRVKQIQSAR